MGLGSNPTPDSVSFVISKIYMTVSFAYFPYLRLITKEKSDSISITIRMAEWFKARDSILRNRPLLKLSFLATNGGVGSNLTPHSVSFAISKIHTNVSFAYFPYLILITK